MVQITDSYVEPHSSDVRFMCPHCFTDVDKCLSFYTMSVRR